MTTVPPGIRVHDRVDDLPLDELAALTGTGALYDSPDWLRYCEQSAAGGTRHLTLTDERGRLVGLTSLRIVPDQNVLGLYNLASLIGAQEPTEELARRGLFPNGVAAVSGAHCVLLTAGDGGPAERSGRRRLLVRAAAGLAEDEGCRTVGFLYLTDADAVRDVSAVLGAAAGPPFLAAAHTELTTDWPDFDGYLGTLHRSRRNKVRRERREFLGSGLTVRVLHGTDELDETTARLQLAVRKRYSAPGSVESVLADYDHLGRTVGDRVRVFLCERDGKPVGLSLALLDGDRLHLRLVGFDYDATGSDFAYFNLLFYEPIRWGLEHGIRTYSFGTGSYPAKIARGASPVPAYGVVRWPAELREAAAQALAEREAALRERLPQLPPAPFSSASSPFGTGVPS
ncbi:GNAT family N-acetyltransferase [Kitasatospora sp. NPDC001175]|uniref:GNAT family N-acetyltransferase n=1 Tax=Kitasatospora sp. NPDC001175 TaxID=3157103 RepID=UPI003D0595B3